MAVVRPVGHSLFEQQRRHLDHIPGCAHGAGNHPGLRGGGGRSGWNHLDRNDPTVIECFSASVRKLRYGLGTSQEELAERADLHRTYIAGLDRGARNPTLLSMKKLAEGLGVSAADLLSEIKCNHYEKGTQS